MLEIIAIIAIVLVVAIAILMNVPIYYLAGCAVAFVARRR